MAAITTFHNRGIEEFPIVTIGGTATPIRRKRVFLRCDSAGATDTIDLNATVDNNINAVKGLVYSNLKGFAGAGTTTVDIPGGTSLVTVAGAGTYDICVEVEMK